VVVVNDTSAGSLETADYMNVGFGAGFRLVPVTSEMDRLDSVCSLSLYKEDLSRVSTAT
jgi:hypothetical protein